MIKNDKQTTKNCKDYELYDLTEYEIQIVEEEK